MDGGNDQRDLRDQMKTFVPTTSNEAISQEIQSARDSMRDWSLTPMLSFSNEAILRSQSHTVITAE